MMRPASPTSARPTSRAPRPWSAGCSWCPGSSSEGRGMNHTTSTDLHDLGVARLAAALRERQVSAVEAAQHFLARAKGHQGLGAYVAIDEDVTLAQARVQDAAIAAGNAPPLAGVPIAHKDIFVTRDFPTTAASRMLAGYRSPFEIGRAHV